MFGCMPGFVTSILKWFMYGMFVISPIITVISLLRGEPVEEVHLAGTLFGVSFLILLLLRFLWKKMWENI